MKWLVLLFALVFFSVFLLPGCFEPLEPGVPDPIVVALETPCVNLPDDLYTTRFRSNVGDEPSGCVVKGYLKGRYVNSAFESDGDNLLLGKHPGKGEICPKMSDTIEINCLQHYYKKTVGEMLEELKQDGYITLSHK